MSRELDVSDSESYRRGEKRSLDEEGTAISVASKRSHVGMEDEAFVKFLVPCVVPGMIIGSAGATIAELMEATHTNIKFSRGQEQYPGTNERVCCICGNIRNICEAIREIFARMNDPSHSRFDELQNSLGRFKMLISNIAAGMIIGKSGQTIKSLQEENGVKIQISKKDETASLPERILTITAGEPEAIVRALAPILELTRNDPDIHKWKKLLSYAGYSSRISSSSPGPLLGSTGNSSGGYSGHSLSSLHTSPVVGSTQDYSTSSSFLSMLQHPAYASFTGTSMAQAAQAQAAHAQAQAAQAHVQAQANAGASFNAAMLSYTYAQSLMTNSSYLGHANPVMVDGVNLMVPGATLCTYEIAIPEIMISTVIGHGGKLLSDLMQSTATRITLSGKGEYIPGTYNRKLTIIGPILSVQAAQMIIVQKIMKEQEAYRKQGLV